MPPTKLTEFYVDPNYTGASSTGTASRPWKSLVTTSPNDQWTKINQALTKTDVTVYLNSLAGTPGAIYCWRSNQSKYRLTIDGMSRARSSAWKPTPASMKYLIWDGHDIGLGINSEMTAYPMNNVTLKGFKLTGSGSRLAMAGNNVVVEDMELLDITDIDPAVLFHNAVRGDCTQAFGNCTNIRWSRLSINRCMGEAGYFGGNYKRVEDGGCPSWGNTHKDILIEDFTVIDSGYYGGQGDGLDLKAGLQNVTIRNFKFTQTDGGIRLRSQGGRALVSSGVFSGRSNFLLEGIETNCGDLVFSYVNGMTLQKCQLNAGQVQTSWNGEAETANFDVNLLNNLLTHAGISLLSTDGGQIQQNHMAGTAFLAQHGGCVNINSNHNILPKAVYFDNWVEGPDTVYVD